MSARADVIPRPDLITCRRVNTRVQLIVLQLVCKIYLCSLDRTVLQSRNGGRRVSRTCIGAMYVSVKRDYLI